MRSIAFVSLALLLASPSQAQNPASSKLEIQRNGTTPSQRGPAETFTGAVRTDNPFRGWGASRVSGSHVTFEPGARTAWHTHPLGQTLIVTQGCGLVQAEGGPIEAIQPGDVVWIPAATRHWHGASPTKAMSHLAIVESLNGSRVQWMEHVSDQQYRAGAPVCA
jgi:quercetin dioxygenase-like cupin family protein